MGAEFILVSRQSLDGDAMRVPDRLGHAFELFRATGNEKEVVAATCETVGIGRPNAGGCTGHDGRAKSAIE